GLGRGAAGRRGAHRFGHFGRAGAKPDPRRAAHAQRGGSQGADGRRQMKALVPAIVVLAAAPAAAQEAGWHYSPYPGEGDRAALGCAHGSTPQVHTCIAVRCEDDYTVAVHLDTTRLGGDAGRWQLEIDNEDFTVTAVEVEDSPYGAKVSG